MLDYSRKSRSGATVTLCNIRGIMCAFFVGNRSESLVSCAPEICFMFDNCDCLRLFLVSQQGTCDLVSFVFKRRRFEKGSVARNVGVRSGYCPGKGTCSLSPLLFLNNLHYYSVHGSRFFLVVRAYPRIHSQRCLSIFDVFSQFVSLRFHLFLSNLRTAPSL